MSWARLRGLLLRRQEQQSPSFKREIQRLSLAGLRALGLLAAGATTFIYLLGMFIIPTIPGHTMLAMDAAQVLWGLVLIALSFS